jgi:hypothetical protein
VFSLAAGPSNFRKFKAWTKLLNGGAPYAWQAEHGYVSYFEVVDADRDALNIERQLIRSRQAQAAATIALVRALGGGWNGADPTPAASQLAQSR